MTTKPRWEKLRQTVLNPSIDEAELETRLTAIAKALPTPIFWLLGKAQSGKTSIIRALTGDSRAQIGDGIRPCTRTAYVYEFPDHDDCVLRFLDTRGLGEVDYNPGEDMAVFQQQAHVLVVVMKAMDHAQQAVITAVEKIVQRQSDWPIIVVQTCLHEGYPDPTAEHITPYPYDQRPLPPIVPSDLARSLIRQQSLFADYNARFVAVDFTLPEDGYTNSTYGLEALWDAIEASLPQGLAGMMRSLTQTRRELRSVYGKAAHPHIVAYAVLAGAAGAIPVPFIDVPLVTGVQAKLFQTIASIYGQQLDRQGLGDIGSALGVSFLSNWGRRELIKFIPGYGAAVSSLLTAATTYALGKTLAAYFDHIRRGTTPDPALLRQLYTEQLARGREVLRDSLNALQKRP